MNGDAAGIDGGHSRGGNHGQSLGTARHQVTQKSRLARAGLAGEEYAYIGMFYEVPSALQVFGRLHG